MQHTDSGRLIAPSRQALDNRLFNKSRLVGSEYKVAVYESGLYGERLELVNFNYINFSDFRIAIKLFGLFQRLHERHSLSIGQGVT